MPHKDGKNLATTTNDRSDDDSEDDEEESVEEWELWHAAYDQAGRTYYFHEITNEVTWIRPECLGSDDDNGKSSF